MVNWIWDYLSTEGFQPHGICLLWRPDVFWTHLISDGVIVVSYFSIPAALIYIAIRRSDLVYGWMLYLFSGFIVACGLTHILAIWTMWVPDYGVEGLIKAVTAAVSLATAISLWPLMPKLLALPSATQLEEKNAALAGEASERESAQAALEALNRSLEDRVTQRTHELQTLNAELSESRADAVQANHAKDQFLAMMSHELRTPLNAVIGFSEIISGETYGPVGNTTYREYAEDIHQSGLHLLELINDILDLSKIESGVQEIADEIVDIDALVRSVAALVNRSALENGLTLTLDLKPEPPALRGDRRKIKQVLINLLSNAIKFTPAGGSVTLRGWTPETGGYVFQVIDTGIGMAVEDIPNALTPFRQIDSPLDRKHEGTGLGLPLAKSLVELHGGTLSVESAVGEGATVTVRFPAARVCGDDLPAAERA